MASTGVTNQGLAIRDNATKFHNYMVNQMKTYNIRWTEAERIAVDAVADADNALKAAVYEIIYKRHNALKNRKLRKQIKLQLNKNKKPTGKFARRSSGSCPHCGRAKTA